MWGEAIMVSFVPKHPWARVMRESAKNKLDRENRGRSECPPASLSRLSSTCWRQSIENVTPDVHDGECYVDDDSEEDR